MIPTQSSTHHDQANNGTGRDCPCLSTLLWLFQQHFSCPIYNGQPILFGRFDIDHPAQRFYKAPQVRIAHANLTGLSVMFNQIINHMNENLILWIIGRKCLML